MAHDRHIRFGTNAVSLGACVDRLSRPMMWDSDGTNWQYPWAEDALRQLAQSSNVPPRCAARGASSGRFDRRFELAVAARGYILVLGESKRWGCWAWRRYLGTRLSI